MLLMEMGQLVELTHFRVIKSKRVAKCNFDMEIIEEFESVLEAKAKTGINNSKIGECCNGKRRSAGGYKWKWL